MTSKKREQITLDQALRAVEGSKGNIRKIAIKLKCSRQHVYNLRNKWVTFDEAIVDSKESFKDQVEEIIEDKILDGDNTMIIFYAKTQMKDRGYTERHEIEGQGLSINIAGLDNIIKEVWGAGPDNSQD